MIQIFERICSKRTGIWEDNYLTGWNRRGCSGRVLSEGVGGEIERLCRRGSGGHGGLLLLKGVGAGAVAQAGAAGERGARRGGGRRVAGSPGPAAVGLVVTERVHARAVGDGRVCGGGRRAPAARQRSGGGGVRRGRKLIAGVIIPGGGLKKKTLSMSLNRYQY